jgi:glycosyltransferase involved in cell wall biosynthesis
MRIHALTVDRGGCFHYRVRQPLTYLRELGHVTSWGSGIDVETYSAANVLVTQYINLGASVDQWVQWCERGDKLCVWDADDDVFQTEQVIGKGTAYDDPGTLGRMARAIAASHLVTVTTPALAEVYARYNDNVVVLPNCVPDWLLCHDMPDAGDRFSLVYSCSPSHLRDIQDFAATLARFMRREPSTELRFYGPSARPIGVPSSWPIRTFGWEKQTDAYLRSLSGKVGIAPLSDLEFNYGKSGIKAQEYQALGIVPVVQDFPQYRAVVIDGVTGFLCRTPADWLRALQLLARSPARRATMAAAGREHARSFGQSSWAPLWEETYRKGLEAL